MLNSCQFIGRWGKDPEIFQGKNGTDILNVPLAVSDPYDKDNPTFIDVKAFKGIALNAHQYTQKGSKVGIVGKLQQERWEKDGQKRSKHVIIAQQIVFLDEKGGNSQGSKPPDTNNQKSNDPFADNGEPIDISDDDLPF